VYCDHQPLKWLNKVSKPNTQLFNWSLRLSQYRFTIYYRPGKMNEEADCLSRNPNFELSAADQLATQILEKENISPAAVHWLSFDEVQQMQLDIPAPLPKKCTKEN